MAAAPRRRIKELIAVEEDEDQPKTEQLDAQDEQATLTGEIGQADEDPFLVQLAKQLGYKEAEEWDREPEKRLSVRSFLEGTPKVIASLKESSERSARAAAEAIEDERRRAREEATRILVESEDKAEREKAKQTLADNAEVPPQTRAWIAQNPWWTTDKSAQRVAANAMLRAHAVGLPIEEQLMAGEEAAKRQYPQYFAPSVSEQRLSDVRRAAPTPPQVQQGTRATVTQTRERGFAQIPRADRDAFTSILLPKFMARGQTEEQAKQRYAESYWRKPPPAPEDRGEELYPMTPQPSVWAKRRR